MDCPTFSTMVWTFHGLNVVIAKMPGAEEFCTREPNFEGEEVFGSQKRKVDIPLRSKYELHRPDRVNFSCP
jgi:hypothetical protein